MRASTPTCSTLSFFLLQLASALPSNLSSRDSSLLHHTFAAGKPTCGNDPSMSAFSTTKKVITQPDCDIVINTICTAVEKQKHTGEGQTGLGHTFGTCEGHILFNGKDDVDHDSCVKGFQSITTTCMLVQDPAHDFAKYGEQFGAINVDYDAGAKNYPDNSVAAWTPLGSSPGYLMGPPHVFGDKIGGKEAEDV